VATSSATFFRQIGGSVGTALFGTIMTARLATELATAVPPGISVDPGQLTGSPAIIAALPQVVQDNVREAFVVALTGVFWWAIPICLVAFVASLFLPEQRLRTAEDVEAAMAKGSPADRAAEIEATTGL
jgi:hypothetical protein